MTGQPPRTPKLEWTEERVTNLRELHAKDLSAGAIAVRMGLGLTRNAIIGKLHRLGLRPHGGDGGGGEHKSGRKRNDAPNDTMREPYDPAAGIEKIEGKEREAILLTESSDIPRTALAPRPKRLPRPKAAPAPVVPSLIDFRTNALAFRSSYFNRVATLLDDKGAPRDIHCRREINAMRSQLSEIRREEGRLRDIADREAAREEIRRYK